MKTSTRPGGRGTPVPIVDAATRCLLAEGGCRSLNFRAQAIHASFQVNLCGIDWRFGALHYMRHLLDGDCAIGHYQWAMQARGQRWAPRGQVAVNRCDPPRPLHPPLASGAGQPHQRPARCPVCHEGTTHGQCPTTTTADVGACNGLMLARVLPAIRE